MIYLFDKDEKLIKIVRKSAVKTALQKYALTTERYVSDRLTVELKGLNADEIEQVEYMAIQTLEDAHTFHYFYVAQKSSDELTTLIGVQSGIEELRKSPVYDKRPQNAFARDVITDLLAGTNWQARFVGETTPHSTNFYYTSVFDALKKVCEVWDLEMQFFVEMNGNRIGGRYIDFKRRIGEAVGKRVVYGHNALQILQEVERTNIFTALIGRGKGEETGAGYGRKITFEDVTWSTDQGKPVNKPKGQKYLELPLMTQQYGIKNADGSMRPKIGFVDFSEEENPEVLIERTYRTLVDSARPQLTLKTSSVYLKGVKIGDTIRVVRHDKKLDYDTRIFEITFNRLNNQSSDIKLGDRIGESNEAKVQTIADKAVEQFINNEFSTFVQNLPNHLPSADGFNNNWYGAEDPTVQYPGKVLINDIWFKPDPEHEGHKIMLRWAGEVWEEILRTYESESLRDRIAEEIAQVNQTMQAQSEEHDRQVADILSKTQSVEEARAQFATVSQAINTAKTELQTAIASADQKARDSQASATALRNDLNLQASKILEQAQAQTDLTNRVTTVETLADGTRSTVAELSRTMNEATQNITSVISRTRTVEDTLSQTRTQYETLTQSVNAQTGQIDSINRKTADLQSGIDGVTERFESLRVGGRNLIPGTAAFSGTHWEKFGTWRLEESLYKGAGILTWVSGNKGSPMANISVQSGDTYTFSAYIKKENAGTVYFYLYDTTETRFATANVPRETSIRNVGDSFQRFTITFRVTRSGLLRPRFAISSTDEGGFSVAGYQLESGTLATDWSPAPEDINSELSSTKTLITQTAEGQTQLSNRLTTTQDKVSTAETKINQLIGDVSSKVSQTDYNTLTGRVSSAETAITQNANEISKRLTSTQVEQAITGKGYQTKAQVDDNITGRGYITDAGVNSKLQGYVTSTTYNNYVQETADAFQRTISQVEGKIPAEIGGVNKLRDSDTMSGSGWFNSTTSRWRKSNELYRTLPIFEHVSGTKNTPQCNYDVQSGETYTFSCYVKKDSGGNIHLYLFDGTKILAEDREQTFLCVAGEWRRIVFSFTAISNGTIAIRLAASADQEGVFKHTPFKLESGSIATDWSPAPEDLATVTALHAVNDTVDSHTRTIGAIGTAGSILDNVSKVTQTAAGLVQEVSGANGLKTQVSQLAGSWAVQNLTDSGTVLNQLNLNKDGSVKIDGKLVQITGTTYIQDGVITSAKIADLDAGKITAGTLDAARIKASSIDGSKLVFDQAFFTGLTANEAYLEQLFAKDAFITQVQAVTLSANKISGGILSATNDAMQMDLNNANISFNTNAAINFNSANNALVRRRGTHTAFLHFNDVASSADANAGGVYAGLGVTSSGDGINSESSGRFSGIRIFRSAIRYNHVATVDQVELYGDTIYLKDGFDGSRGYVFKTSKTVNQTIDMNLYINAIKAIAHCLNHLRSNNWDWKMPNLQSAVSGLMDNYINKTDFYNKL